MTTPPFEPDYQNLLDVLCNRRPKRLPLYEHAIDLPFINKTRPADLVLQGTSAKDYQSFYTELAGFWKSMNFDGLAYEAAICEILPDHGAINGGRPGPIQTRADFEAYPFDEIPKIFWESYTPHLEALRKSLPAGMKAYGGCGYGIFETSEDLAGFECLCIMQYLDPDLFADLFKKIGDLFVTLWAEMIRKYSDIFVFFRMGDDLGFKNSTLLDPIVIRQFILPQYQRVIDLVHHGGKKFLLHSCGNIFSVMDDLISIGIDAKHSNEDQIAPFEKWIHLYGEKIGLFGGIDVNTLCLNGYDEVYRQVLETGQEYRELAKGWGLGSGNSIASYVPVEGFLGMVDAARELQKIS